MGKSIGTKKRCEEERKKVLEKRRVQIGTRIGRLCHSVYQEGSRKDLLGQINGEDLGDVNHSKDFVEKLGSS